MNTKIVEILLSPDDGTPIRENLKSDGGISYKTTDSGVLLLAPRKTHLSDAIYSSPTFEKWDAIVGERIKYYTEKQTFVERQDNSDVASMEKLEIVIKLI
ncbi:MAG: hypothetical protein HY865_13560 [Chloroflexi bacterium]|nr:hypothetical protein [Chloroflexota bacterium]